MKVSTGTGPTVRQQKAIHFLEALLQDGPRGALEVKATARAYGIGRPSLDYACGYLGLIKRKQELGAEQYWEWYLPGTRQVRIDDTRAEDEKIREHQMQIELERERRREARERYTQDMDRERYAETADPAFEQARKAAEHRAAERAKYNPDEICQCGHERNAHDRLTAYCYLCVDTEHDRLGCEKFIAAIPE